jgi:hypothetical protein
MRNKLWECSCGRVYTPKMSFQRVSPNAEKDGRDLFKPRRFDQMSPREFRNKIEDAMRAEIIKVARFVDTLCLEQEVAYVAFHDKVTGDQAKVRSTSPADPTSSVVETHDRARRELEKAVGFAFVSFARHQNELDARTRNLEIAMARLKPGPSARNPRFEVPVRGDAKLPKPEREELAEAQERRIERGEAFGG